MILKILKPNLQSITDNISKSKNFTDQMVISGKKVNVSFIKFLKEHIFFNKMNNVLSRACPMNENILG